MVNVHSSGEWSSWHRSLWSNFGSLGARRGCHSTLSFSYILRRFYSFFNLVRRIGGRGSGKRGSRKRDGSGTGPILLNWAAPPTSERSSPGRGILISSHLSRATRGTIGRLQAQTLRDFLLPFRLAKGAASLHTPTKRFQFLRVVGWIDPLEPIRWHLDRPRRQQRPLFSRRMTALPQA